MKLEATLLTKAQWCEIVTKLSKPNALSKWVLGWEYEVNEGAIQKVMETMRIEEEPPIDDENQPIKTFDESKSATDFKGFKVVLSLTSTTNYFALIVQIKAGQMYDELRQSFEIFQQNIKKLTMNVKRKKILAFMANGSTWHVRTKK